MPYRVNKCDTEYGGHQHPRNTVQPQPPWLLSSAEKLRLDNLTGQHTDTKANRQYFHFYGC